MYDVFVADIGNSFINLVKYEGKVYKLNKSSFLTYKFE